LALVAIFPGAHATGGDVSHINPRIIWLVVTLEAACRLALHRPPQGGCGESGTPACDLRARVHGSFPRTTPGLAYAFHLTMASWLPHHRGGEGPMTFYQSGFIRWRFTPGEIGRLGWTSARAGQAARGDSSAFMRYEGDLAAAVWRRPWMAANGKQCRASLHTPRSVEAKPASLLHPRSPPTQRVPVTAISWKGLIFVPPAK